MISKTAEYALRAVACLATSHGSTVSADQLAKQTKVPRRYLSRVLQELCAARLVQSRPGPGGGYELSIQPAEVSILDIVNAVEPIARITMCPLGLKTHSKLCPLHAELDQVYEAAETAFASITVQNLLDSSSQVIPLCENVAK